MVHHCQVCGRSDAFHPELSFHRFPVNPERRRLWFSLVGFDENQSLPKYPQICSDHFHVSDIILKNGRYYVKSGADPIIEHSVWSDYKQSSGRSTTLSNDTESEQSENEQEDIAFLLSSQSKDDNTVALFHNTESKDELKDDNTEIPSTSTSFENVHAENIPIVFVTDATVASDQDVRLSSSQVSLLTMSASETEDAIMRISYDDIKSAKTELTGRFAVIKKRKKRKRRYVGDLDCEDFNTPEKAKLNYRILENTITTQRKKIHKLQLTIESLQNRMKTLKDLRIAPKNISKRKALVSESAVKDFERNIATDPSTQSSQSTQVSTPEVKIRKSNAEYCKKYYDKKRKGKPTVNTVKKTRAEYMKEYRKKYKLIKEQQTASIVTPAPVKQSAAEYLREYRRKKSIELKNATDKSHSLETQPESNPSSASGNTSHTAEQRKPNILYPLSNLDLFVPNIKDVKSDEIEIGKVELQTVDSTHSKYLAKMEDIKTMCIDPVTNDIEIENLVDIVKEMKKESDVTCKEVEVGKIKLESFDTIHDYCTSTNQYSTKSDSIQSECFKSVNPEINKDVLEEVVKEIKPETNIKREELEVSEIKLESIDSTLDCFIPTNQYVKIVDDIHIEDFNSVNSGIKKETFEEVDKEIKEEGCIKYEEIEVGESKHQIVNGGPYHPTS